MNPKALTVAEVVSKQGVKECDDTKLNEATKHIYEAAKKNYDENRDIIDRCGPIALKDCVHADILFIGAGPSAEKDKKWLKILYDKKFWVTMNCTSSMCWCMRNGINVDYTVILDCRYTDIFQEYKDMEKYPDSCKGQTWLCYAGTHRKVLTMAEERGAKLKFFDVNYEDPYKITYGHGDDEKHQLPLVGVGINVANLTLGLAAAYRANSWSSIGDERSWKYDPETEKDFGIDNMYSVDNETYDEKKTRIGNRVMIVEDKPGYITSHDLYNSRTWLFNNFVVKKWPGCNVQIFDLSDARIPGIQQLRLEDIYNSWKVLKDAEIKEAKKIKNRRRRRKK